MAYQIPFQHEVFRPLSIDGNYESARPVTFTLSSASGPDRTRLKAMMDATAGLEQISTAKPNAWTTELQRAVVNAFRDGAVLFVETVEAIENLTVPSSLANKVGLIQELPVVVPQVSDVNAVPRAEDVPYPITTGRQFAAVATYCYMLAFEVAMRLVVLSKEADIPPRFFDWLSTLRKTVEKPSGTATPAKPARVKRATAASPMPTDSSHKVM